MLRWFTADAKLVGWRNLWNRTALQMTYWHQDDISRTFYTVSQKKFPPLKLSVTCEILTDFQNFCTAGKHMKSATKPIRHDPFHLRHVAILSWEIENSNFLQIFSRHERKCNKVAFLSPLTLLLIHKIVIFSVFNISSFLPYWLQLKFSMSLFFYLFTFAINLWHRKFVTADVTAVFVNDQHSIQRRVQDFNKNT